MKFQTVSPAAATTFAIAMLGCSSARVEPPAPAAAVTVPMTFFELPPPPLQEFRACTLGQTCMTMDERPFEPCLLSTTRCSDKIEEPLLVARPHDDVRLPKSSIAVSDTVKSAD